MHSGLDLRLGKAVGHKFCKMEEQQMIFTDRKVFAFSHTLSSLWHEDNLFYGNRSTNGLLLQGEM